jgi:hypothetical protein
VREQVFERRALTLQRIGPLPGRGLELPFQSFAFGAPIDQREHDFRHGQRERRAGRVLLG